LLVDVRAETERHLDRQLDEVEKVLNQCTLLEFPTFTRDKAEVKRLWEIRKGLFPSLGYSRQDGTTIIIEDVAFPLEALAEAALDLRKLFERYGYVDGRDLRTCIAGKFAFCLLCGFSS
jgi:D-lactate dehydrogenase